MRIPINKRHSISAFYKTLIECKLLNLDANYFLLLYANNAVNHILAYATPYNRSYILFVV